MVEARAAGTHSPQTEVRPAERVLASVERAHVDAWCDSHGGPALGRPGEAALTRVLASFWLGETVLPSNLGLVSGDYQRFVAYVLGAPSTLHAEEARQRLIVGAAQEHEALTRERWALRSALASQRSSEVEDLEKVLLTRGAGGAAHSTLVHSVARILANGCLGSAHLWKDLGLRDRPQLRALISEYFPLMITLNTHDMRWKRFFYRQLCEMGGDYLCRAPSCTQCASYSECFASTRDNLPKASAGSAPYV